MKIEIDFNQNDLAHNLYNSNKTSLNSSILDGLKMGGEPVSLGQSLRIPTTQYANNNSIKALKFIIGSVTEDSFKLVLDSAEK
jgi:hypothetical protein